MPLLACVLTWVDAPAPRPANPPNFVFLIADDHGYFDSTVQGATDVRTPNMQRLAASGMRFDRAFAASPSCAPARAALLTGLMPARNGAEANHTYKREGINSLPETLRRLGYTTAAFGKVAHGQDAPRHGFDHIDPRYDVATVEAFLKARDASKPLCLFVGTHEPHVPWAENQGYDPAQLDVPPNHVDTPETRFWRARYYTDVTAADTWLGQLWDLARRSLPDNTLVLYTSDQGAQWPFAKWNLYDVGIRIPLLISWPGHIQPETNSQAMISSVDILPTLITLAGGVVPDNIDGRSFADTLTDPRSSHRDLIFSTHSGDGRMNVYPIRAVRTDRWKYIRNLHPEFQHTTHINRAQDRDGLKYWLSWEEAARLDPTAAQKVNRYKHRPLEELYDLQSDPFELHNLTGAAGHETQLETLRNTLDRWMNEQNDRQTVFDQPLLLNQEATPIPPKAAAKRSR